MKSFIASFCVLSILFSASKRIVCDSEMKQITNFVCSLVFLVTLFSYISNLKINSEYTFPSDENVMYDTQDDIYKIVSEPVIGAILEDENIAYEKIAVKTDKSSENGIVISKVTVYSQEDREKIKEAIMTKADVKEVEVVGD